MRRIQSATVDAAELLGWKDKIDPGRAGRRDPHAGRPGAAHRRHQARSAALDGRLTDLAGFSRLGDEGVDLFLVDSTNADEPGFVIAEGEIGPVLDSMFHRASARIIVACFASHVHRVQQVFDAAAEHGRRVCLVGRSMVRNMGIAAEMGYLNVPQGLLVELDDAMALPDDELVLISTGSQGEPLSALSRMARGDHRTVRIRPEDTVILASSLIPGNETAVFAVINGLIRLGAHGRAPGQREGARLGPRAGGRAAVPLQRGAARATSCPCTGSGATSAPTARWR